MAQTNHTDGLLEDFGTAEAGALPFVVAKSLMGCRDLAGSGHGKGHCVFGGGVNVGGGGIDNHDTTGGGSGNINIVEADSGTADDLEFVGNGKCFRVDGGGRTHQYGVCVGESCKQFWTVRTIDPADFYTITQCIYGRLSKFVGNQHNGTSILAHGILHFL